jgi:hypothetical protein
MKRNQEIPEVQRRFVEKMKERLSALRMSDAQLSREIERVSAGKHTISCAKICRIKKLNADSSPPSIVDAFWIDQVLGMEWKTRVRKWFRSSR